MNKESDNVVKEEYSYHQDIKKENRFVKFLLNLLSSIICVAVFFLARGCTRTIITNPKLEKRYTAEDMKVAKDAGFIKGFEIMNTSELSLFCTDSGYVPILYINEFKQQFARTIANANSIIVKYDKNEDFEQLIKEKMKQEGLFPLQSEFESLRKEYGITKEQ